MLVVPPLTQYERAGARGPCGAWGLYCLELMVVRYEACWNACGTAFDIM
jgi:hypothetical protein